MSLVEAIQTKTLELEPSCLAFTPDDTGCFVVGTYHLHSRAPEPTDLKSKDDESLSQVRSGSLYLYRLEGEQMWVF